MGVPVYRPLALNDREVALHACLNAGQSAGGALSHTDQLNLILLICAQSLASAQLGGAFGPTFFQTRMGAIRPLGTTLLLPPPITRSPRRGIWQPISLQNYFEGFPRHRERCRVLV